MTPITRGSIALLAVMLLVVFLVANNRIWRFDSAGRQSRAFAGATTPLFRSSRLEDVPRVAQRYRMSHIAGITSAAIEAILVVPPEFSRWERAGFAERAMLRRRRSLIKELRANLGALHTIFSTAPFVGLFGTVFGILNVFRGSIGNRATILRMIAYEISEALVPTALGLLVGILAIWFYNYFMERTELFEIEMRNAALEIMGQFSVGPQPQLFRLNTTAMFRQSRWHFDLELFLVAAVGCVGLYELWALAIILAPVVLAATIIIWALHRRDSRILLFP